VRGEWPHPFDDQLDATVDRPAGRGRALGRGTGGAQGEVDQVVVLGFLEP
jgi:hypothetical protein